MNLIKKYSFGRSFLSRQISGLALAIGVVCMAVTPMPAMAMDSATLAWVNSMKGIYKTTATSSGTAAASSSLNTTAATDPLCDSLKESKKKAAEAYVKNKLPPDPLTVIENSSCFLDVMDIKIPTTGNAFLDGFVGLLTPHLKSSSCEKASNFWGGIKSNMTSGNFSSLTNQIFTAANATTSGNSSTSYSASLFESASNALNGVVGNNGGTTGGTSTVGAASTNGSTNPFLTTAQNLGLPTSVQNSLDMINSTGEFNTQLVQQVDTLTSNLTAMNNAGLISSGSNNDNWWGSSNNTLMQQVSSLRSLLGL